MRLPDKFWWMLFTVSLGPAIVIERLATAQDVRYVVETPNCGSIGADGTYTAPAKVPTATTCVIKAQSVVDGTKTDTARVELAASPPAIASVTIAPKSIALKPGETAKFTATVTLGDAPVPAPTPVQGATVFEYLAGYPKLCGPPKGVGYEAGALPFCTPPGESPASTFPKPAVGGTYVDANFGSTLRVIADGGNHTYSSLAAASPDGASALLHLASSPGSTSIVDSKTGTARLGRPGRVDAPGAGTPHWHPTDSDVYYYIDGNQIKRHRIAANETTVVVSAAQFGRLCDGSAGNISSNGWYGVFANSLEDTCDGAIRAATPRQVCVANVFDGRLICADYSSVAIQPVQIQGVLPMHGPDSLNGKHYVFVGSIPAATLYTINETAGRLDFVLQGPDLPPSAGTGNGDGICQPSELVDGRGCNHAPHLDVGHDSKGRQFILLQMDDNQSGKPCGTALVALPVALEREMITKRVIIMRLMSCGGFYPWVNLHLSCAVGAPVCAFSSDYPFGPRNDGTLYQPDPADPATLTRTLGERGDYWSEIVAVKMEDVAGGSFRVRRLAQHRSLRWRVGDEAYWTTPRASINASGVWIVYDSNLGYAPADGKRQVLVVGTGF